MSTTINSFKPFPIDKLEKDYSNWIVYSTQIESCILASGLAKHLDGRAVEPKDLMFDRKSKKWVDGDGREAEADKVAEFEKRHDEWTMVQAHIKSQLFYSIPESLLITIRNLPTDNKQTKKETE